MSNGDKNRPILLPGKGSRLEKAERAIYGLIDFVFGMHALLMEKGYYTQEECNRMASIAAEARRKLAGNFDVEAALKAIQAAYRIEIRGMEKPK